MAVVNIAANMQHASPVRSAMKGKALRAATKAKEVETAALEDSVARRDDLFDQKSRELDIAERSVAVREAAAITGAFNADTARKQLDQEIGKEKADMFYQHMFGVFTSAEKIGDPDLRRKFATDGLIRAGMDLPPTHRKMIDSFLEDGVLDQNEYEAMRAEADVAVGEFDTPVTVGANSRVVDVRSREILIDTNEAASEGYAPTAFQKHLDELVAAGTIDDEQRQDLLLSHIEKAAMPESAKERQIAELTGYLGGDREAAFKIAHGLATMKQNSVTGRVEVLDLVTGTATEIPVAGEMMVEPTIEPGRTLWDLSRFATGPTNAVVAGVSIPAAWMGLEVGAKVNSARQTFRTTSQSLIRSLAINKRYAIGEQERIREEISLLPAVMDDPILMRQRMLSIESDLNVRLQQATNDANNTSLSAQTRGDAAKAAADIRNYIAIMGIPAKPTSEAEVEALPDGARWLDPTGVVRIKRSNDATE